MLQERVGNTPVASGFTYRPEIDGLRAFAVGAVILFHAGFEVFAGGYVGVDVFFVISGYLITSIIVSEQRAGTFTIMGFYERRVRRIIPALVFMLVTCLPLVFLWLNPTRLDYYTEAAAAAIGFASNIFFWRHTDYFSVAGDMNPLLHTWSLAIEEQFYLVFPPLMILFHQRWRAGAFPVIAAIGVASFLLCSWVWADEPTSAFFLTPARAWELAAGCLVALYLADHRPALPGPVQSASALVGLVLILAPVFLFDRATPFPGVYALLPVVGTVLIILFARRGNLAGGMLALKPIVGIGLISYSAYLWHQPVFAFARLTRLELDDPLVPLGLIALVFAIAWASWRFVETPFRDRRRTNQTHVIRLAAATFYLGVGVGALGLFGEGFPGRYGAAYTEMAASVERSPVTDRCNTSGSDFTPPAEACTFFDGPVTWAALGDSLAIEPAYSLAEALRPRGEALLQLTHTLCPPALAFDARPGCRDWTAQALDRIKAEDGLKNVVLAYNHAEYLYGDIEDTFPELPDALNIPNIGLGPTEARALYWQSFRALVETLSDAGLRVFVLYPHPEIGQFMVDVIYPSNILAASEPPRTHIGMSRDLFLERQAPVFAELDALTWGPSLVAVRPHEWLCDGLDCYAMRDGQPYYSDNNHLTLAATEIVAARILELADHTGQ